MQQDQIDSRESHSDQRLDQLLAQLDVVNLPNLLQLDDLLELEAQSLYWYFLLRYATLDQDNFWAALQ
jgi:hypothetical protein